MTAQLALIQRYPIKGIGGETVPQARLQPSRPLSGDRIWGLLHQAGERHATRDQGGRWLPKSCFLQAAKSASLQAIKGGWGSDEAWGAITLTHPERPDLTFDPQHDSQLLVDWIAPLWPAELPAPTRLIPAPTAFTDVSQPYISILSLGSLAALEQALGQPVGTDRWRANLWIDGWQPGYEAELIGQILRIGEVELRIAEAIGRCPATSANSVTGRLDLDMPARLKQLYGNMNFGIYAQVITGGTIRPGDEVSL